MGVDQCCKSGAFFIRYLDLTPHFGADPVSDLILDQTSELWRGKNEFCIISTTIEKVFADTNLDPDLVLVTGSLK